MAIGNHNLIPVADAAHTWLIFPPPQFFYKLSMQHKGACIIMGSSK